jgi:tetratricopeptide (TPR) repeat protein
MKRIVLASMCVAAGCALLSRPSPALAQPQGGARPASADAHAREAFKKGEALFRAGRYLEALAQFSGGYELSQRPLFLFNMGECARKLGQTERARAYYQRYIDADKGGKLVALAEKRIAELGGPVVEDEPAAKPPAVDAGGTAKSVAVPPPAAVAERPTRSVPAAALQADAPPEESRPLWKKWPFWAAVGAAAVTTTAVVLATSSGDGGCTGTCVDFR